MITCGEVLTQLAVIEGLVTDALDEESDLVIRPLATITLDGQEVREAQTPYIHNLRRLRVGCHDDDAAAASACCVPDLVTPTGDPTTSSELDCCLLRPPLVTETSTRLLTLLP